jgi:hypothetical protein
MEGGREREREGGRQGGREGSGLRVGTEGSRVTAEGLRVREYRVVCHILVLFNLSPVFADSTLHEIN